MDKVVTATQRGVVAHSTEERQVKVGVPKEVKNHEYRVAITPIGVHELTSHGHEVVHPEGRRGRVRRSSDDEYVAAGAKIVATAEEAWGTDGGSTWCSRSRSRSPRSTPGCGRG